MKESLDLRRYQISKKEQQNINGGTGGGCASTCIDTCYHYIQIPFPTTHPDYLQKRFEAEQCEDDCERFCS